MTLVLSQIAASPTTRPIRVKGAQLRRSPRGDLQHLPAIEVAGVHDKGDAWITVKLLSELRPPPGQPPEGLLFPQIPERAHGRPAPAEGRHPRYEWLTKESVEVEAVVDRPPAHWCTIDHGRMMPQRDPSSGRTIGARGSSASGRLSAHVGVEIKMISEAMVKPARA